MIYPKFFFGIKLINNLMKRKLIIAFAFILILFTIQACNREIPARPFADDAPFLPLVLGKSICYKVVDINYKIYTKNDTNTYRIKETVQDTFTDFNKQLSYKIYRYKSENISPENWQIDSVWFAYKANNQIFKVENNVSFAKLSLPLANKKLWDGNVKNDLGKENYLVFNYGKPYNVRDSIFQNTVLIQQGEDTASNAVSQNKKIEVYAYDKGLIYKESKILTKEFIKDSAKVITKFGNWKRQTFLRFE